MHPYRNPAEMSFLLVSQTRRASLSVSVWKNKILCDCWCFLFFYLHVIQRARMAASLPNKTASRPHTSSSWVAAGSAPVWSEGETLPVPAQLVSLGWTTPLSAGNLNLSVGRWHLLNCKFLFWVWAIRCVCVCVSDLYGMIVNPLIEEWGSSACVMTVSIYYKFIVIIEIDSCYYYNSLPGKSVNICYYAGKIKETLESAYWNSRLLSLPVTFLGLLRTYCEMWWMTDELKRNKKDVCVTSTSFFM